MLAVPVWFRCVHPRAVAVMKVVPNGYVRTVKAMEFWKRAVLAVKIAYESQPVGHRAWIIAKLDGQVVSAHCMCMAE